MYPEASDMKLKSLLLGLVLALLWVAAAAGEPAAFYKPEEFSGMDLENAASRWCWQRSVETDHFFIFWEAGFGEDPAGASVPEAMRVDLPALTEAVEPLWQLNARTLGMLTRPSRLDSYKMQIYLLYTEEWVAAGSGYDNRIGALWVSPAACRPIGSVIAHEIGHCFQYQVYCDQLLGGMADDGRHGFRYGHGIGNGFWEQCAQWAAFEAYPGEALTGADFAGWPENAHRAFEHEWTRYQSYWLPLYWTDLCDEDTVSRLWLESRRPEDALGAYLRLFCGGDVDQLNEMLYGYATHMATYDLPSLQPWRQAGIGTYRTAFYDAGNGWLQVGYASCPQEGGFNVVEIDAAPGAELAVTFEGLAPGSPLASDDPGVWHAAGDEAGVPAAAGQTDVYNPSDVDPGWRYGIVILMDDGSVRYGEMHRNQQDTVRAAVPEGADRVMFVVVGAADRVVPNPWDEDERTDFQMPYRIRINSTGDVDGH